jgi:hypothetical protein
MGQMIGLFFLGVGVCLLLAGVALGGLHSLSELSRGFVPTLFSGISLAGVGGVLARRLREWTAEKRLQRAQEQASPLATALTPQLFGEYTPYVLEAAEKLGAERDTTAVPALLRALEQSVDVQRPGWRDRAEALANALARIGDRRALPLLYRLENVRGIGFIPAIRNAITSIEPQTSLLRPGSADYALPGTLLRPAQARPAEEPALLLRAAEGEER